MVPDRPTPGIFVEEAPRGEQAIATSPPILTAFVGRTLRGPVDEPVTVRDMEEFHRAFGERWDGSTLEPCLHDYFENGGQHAVIVRVMNGGRRAMLRLPAGDSHLVLEAENPGGREWLRASVDYDNIDPKEDLSFNLVLQRTRGPRSERITDQEIYARLSVDPSSNRYVGDALLDSRLMRLRGSIPSQRPDRTVGPGVGSPVAWVFAETPGTDGEPLTDYDIIGSATEARGLFALQKIPTFHFLCIPPPSPVDDVGPTALLAAIRLCRQRRALLLMDPPNSCQGADDVIRYLQHLNLSSENAVIAFPRLKGGGPLGEETSRSGCGALAGLLARSERGQDAWTPWSDAPRLLRGAARPAVDVSRQEADRLVSHGVNVFRRLGGSRVALTGERTLAGVDAPIPMMKSVRIRRLAMLIEEALRHGTRWVVFEVPGEQLRARVRRQVEEFLGGLEAKGAFPTGGGYPPFFVKCDSETNPQGVDVRGALHFIVGFAVGEPGNYLIYRVSQTVESAKVVPVSIDRFRFAV
jgi:hypothetical protein